MKLLHKSCEHFSVYNKTVKTSQVSCINMFVILHYRGLISYHGRSYHIEPSFEIGRGVHKLFIEHDDRPASKHNCGKCDRSIIK